MVRFSCFHAHLHKGKKSVQRSAEEMHKILEDRLAMNNPTQLKTEVDVLQNSSEHASESSPNEKDWKSEEIDWKSNGESDSSNNRISHFKKSRSLGSGLNWISKVSNDNDSEDETDRSLIHSEVIVRSNSKDFRTTIPDQSQEAIPSASFRECSISIPEKEGQENSELHLSGVGESSDHAPRTPPAIVRSSSLPNIDFLVCHSTHSLRHSRSVDDVIELAPRHRERSIYDIRIQVTHNDSGIKNGKGNYENAGEDSYYASEYARSAKDWIIPHADNENHQKESLFCRLDELPSKDFKIRRIEDWVKNLQRYPIEEPSSPFTFDELEVPESEGSPVAKLDSKVDPSKEAVKKYISSLSSTSTAAQLSNHGLVVIPFLSALTNLRAINLSGNAIVRITAGSLPRGLHVLNLSKNSISTIEGLKELTRLRVLDLSYNRIFRIGHGLSYCSSLKELYLAGNRISEVEGIHRLLKLNVLDLRFNRISTTKSLGQLAANYNSLQAISLEGNPAHKNIGDEQLKKNLQGLLPHLAYYNRQPIKAGKLKDVADRPTRIGITSRAELKTVRKGSHLAAANNTSSSSARPRRTQAVTSSKASRSRKVRFPPSGTKTGTTRHHVYDFSNKLLNSMPHLSIRRSRSVGTLADT